MSKHSRATPRRMRIFCIANQKGGVGKTTTTVNLAAGLAQLGQRVLVVDLDPQGNATMGSGIDKRALELSVYDVLLENAGDRRGAPASPTGRLRRRSAPTASWPAPRSSWSASSAATSACARALAAVADDYDFVLIDCPPSPQPADAERAVQRARRDRADAVRVLRARRPVATWSTRSSRCTPTSTRDLEIIGLLRVMFDPRITLQQQVSEQLKAHFGDKVFDTVIPRNVRLAEAPSYGHAGRRLRPGLEGRAGLRRVRARDGRRASTPRHDAVDDAAGRPGLRRRRCCRASRTPGINASAPPQQRWLDGWLVRFSPGKAKRARCVNAVAAGPAPLDEQLAACQPRLRRGRAAADRAHHAVHAAGRARRASRRARACARVDDTRVMVRRARRRLDAEALPRRACGSSALGARARSRDGSASCAARRWRSGRRTPSGSPTSPVPFHAFVLRDARRRRRRLRPDRDRGRPGRPLRRLHRRSRARPGPWRSALCRQLLAQRARSAARATATCRSTPTTTPARAVYRRLGFADAYAYHYRTPTGDAD